MVLIPAYAHRGCIATRSVYKYATVLYLDI